MGLDSIVRNAVATANRVTGALQATVQHAAWTGEDGYSKPIYATAVARPAIVEMRQRQRRMPDGREVLQMAVVTFVGPIAPNGAAQRREPVDPRDLITLPSGYTAPILDVVGVVDAGTDAPYMLEVVLGQRMGMGQ